MQNLTYNEILKKLEYYCSYQDRCYKEIEQKLYEYLVTDLEKEKILIYLIENKYINEERFVISFTRGKHFYKNWGKIRLKQELKYRNITQTLIDIAFKEIEDGYEQRFYEYALKKWNAITEINYVKKKNKLINQLSYKGYEIQLIYNFLDDIENKKA